MNFKPKDRTTRYDRRMARRARRLPFDAMAMCFDELGVIADYRRGELDVIS
jgi:hypothetical protein